MTTTAQHQHTCHGAVFCGQTRAAAQAECEACQPAEQGERILQATTPVTDDVQAWLERAFPEGDAYVEHDETCDMSMAGDECEGGCPVYTTPWLALKL